MLNARIESPTLARASRSMARAIPPPTPTWRSRVPLGGPHTVQGYGLAFAIDLLCGAMNGMTVRRHINAMYEELEQPRKIGHLLMAIDPGRFAARLVRGDGERGDRGPANPGRDPLPGEPEERSMVERLAHGIPIDAEALKDMREWSAKLGLKPRTRGS